MMSKRFAYAGKTTWQNVVASILVTAWVFSSQCFAEEIIFHGSESVQHGTVVEEDENSVTIRFPRTSIKSIIGDREKSSAQSPPEVIWEDKGDYFILRIPRRQARVVPPEHKAAGTPDEKTAAPVNESQTVERINRLEKRLEDIERTRASQLSEPPKRESVHEALVQEEMGRVRGVIRWGGMPMKNGKVKIVMTRYTGFSMGALKKLFVRDKKSSNQKIAFVTDTDEQGAYSFLEVPPGYYRLYWQPDSETGWVHRLRDRPDFEVTSGTITVQDIPGNKT